MIFYFIATRPYIEKAIGSRIFIVRADAIAVCAFLNDVHPGDDYVVFQAEATNIMPVEGAK